MDTLGWLLVVGGLILLYAVILVALHRKGWIGKDRVLSFFGPAIMMKTQRGKGALERIAQRSPRFWNAFGDLGIFMALVSMGGMVILLLWEAVQVMSIPASAAPQPAEALALPGINPFIPIGYGLLALILGVVLHEFAHGILARANNVKIRSLGVLWLVIPIGAFVEQDEDEMMKAPARQRDRIAAAGVMANFALAFVFFLMLSAIFATSVHAKADGVGIYGIIPGSPAQNASMAPGDIITALNGSSTPNVVHLRDALAKTHPGQSVDVTWYSQAQNGLTTSSIVLAPASAFESGLGVNGSKTAFLGVEQYLLPPQALASLMENPFGGAAAQAGLGGTATLSTPFLFLALPFIGLEPIQGTTTQFFTVSGPLSALSPGGVWILVNITFWLVWMNVLLGLSNALPAVPLDGGFLFRDALTKVVQKAKSSWSQARLEEVVNRLALMTTLIVFLLILWQFVGPRL
ncbi:MAG: site-2 protease family protein [Candidatus Thermoplasmatota archaeon]|jgi:membrane-associated protease RseP (regulator of RpoE activity)|nr:site-2 protease family protein [Candidatus Thermoplasmatota archaeon]MCL5984165.1 site-2 protease family protein [Candidatus Thermoplasmatota archaeon]